MLTSFILRSLDDADKFQKGVRKIRDYWLSLQVRPANSLSRSFPGNEAMHTSLPLACSYLFGSLLAAARVGLKIWSQTKHQYSKQIFSIDSVSVRCVHVWSPRLASEARNRQEERNTTDKKRYHTHNTTEKLHAVCVSARPAVSQHGREREYHPLFFPIP